ncbi:miniconductance mechanosensitive channel [Aquimarina sp. EL_43]|uniref:mechanosensitive ion channel family protein n=1 Tax=unclassified Aquimarina TaxID=2627091 RepID=UPI0018CB9070|nr:MULTISPECIES: mechanosensitive ion channel domain-containing protein [unclassified Aquimarina]MBG6129854.1 miniconductance mechanosensitive channel [Aquimarina sp. EL_35]MBG6150919.1 miniconductance mechanosensitive channel [Aquimarina sp. EL_32]MBG6167774.1 miniconductance mechanosensitive channel [Aquimarina sp. EL_43]
MKDLTRYFYNLLVSKGISEHTAEYLNLLIGICILVVVLFVLDFVMKKVIVTIFKSYASKSKNTFDDYLVKNKTFDYLAHIVPLSLTIWIVPMLFIAFPTAEKYLETLFNIMVIVLTIWILRSILRTFRDFLKSLDSFKDKPIDSYVQVFMIFVWFIGAILVFSSMTGKSIWTFLTALGAMSAVILLIFKDTILGFVASIQVAVNDTVRIGDWITMQKYGADGDVIEINLSSVKVQNFDKTITTIPTYYLTSQSFKNWRGMMNSGGRRIKRALLIKTSSISFLSEDDLNKLKKIELIEGYLTTTQQKIDSYNQESKIDKSVLMNGRNLTNMGVFRMYVELYLENHPFINKEMTIMSRQLPPSAQGTPLEIYAFSNNKVWKNYEQIMADIFDHLLSAIPYFNLEVFELNYTPEK